MSAYVGNKFGQQDVDKLVRARESSWRCITTRCMGLLNPPRCLTANLQKEFEKRTDPNDKNAQALLEEMRQHIKKVGPGGEGTGTMQ